MLSYLVLVVLVAVAQSSPLGEEDLQWKAWKSFNAKAYSTETEESQRRAIWRNNLEVSYQGFCFYYKSLIP
jgi:Flp pilus assembly protein CpaB